MVFLRLRARINLVAVEPHQRAIIILTLFEGYRLGQRATIVR